MTRSLFVIARARRRGFTLIEVMTATAVTLLLMGLVVQVFAIVGDTVADTRATIQMIDRLRAARQTLQSDLAGVTCPGVKPPVDPKLGLGFIEIVEGPIGSRFFPSAAPMLLANGSLSVYSPLPPGGDSTLGDIDDMVMLTTATQAGTFAGNWQSPTTNLVMSTTSQVAEVCYFLRGTTLYRRQLLVKPSIDLATNVGFYGSNDISVHQEGGTYDYSPNPANLGNPPPPRLVANSLFDLTNRQNRYAHQPFAFPYDVRFWGPLGLPTLRECSFYQTVAGVNLGTWPLPLFDPSYTAGWGTASAYAPANIAAGNLIVPTPPAAAQPYSLVPSAGWPHFPQIPQVSLSLTQLGAFDAWQSPYPWDQTTFPVNTATINPSAPNVAPNGAIYGFSASNTPAAMQPANNMRYAEDVILTNVLSFDVKVWDPDAPVIAHPGIDGLPGLAGIDDDLNGAVDDLSELGAAGSDDLVWQPGDVYPDVLLPAALQGFANYDYSTGTVQQILTTSTNWANNQYLQAFNLVGASTTIIQKGAYVDLAYAQHPNVGNAVGNYPYPKTPFSGPGDFRSQLWAGGWFNNGTDGNLFYVMPAVYDTGSRSYEDDGFDEDLVFVTAYNNGYSPTPALSSYGRDQILNDADDDNCYGIDLPQGESYTDFNNNGFYDPVGDNSSLIDVNGNGRWDPGETEMPPPYPTALGGVQIKIRAFDPDSRQIREVTIVQEFENE
jgi:prepilin-type N-terminal cleavage/methylation domain-containing protein